MKLNLAKQLIAAVVLGFAGAAQAESVTITPTVQQDCQWDYHNFCDQYAIGSELLDMCFKQNARKAIHQVMPSNSAAKASTR